jgi:hypothetical protein
MSIGGSNWPKGFNQLILNHFYFGLAEIRLHNHIEQDRENTLNPKTLAASVPKMQ